MNKNLSSQLFQIFLQHVMEKTQPNEFLKQVVIFIPFASRVKIYNLQFFHFVGTLLAKVCFCPVSLHVSLITLVKS